MSNQYWEAREILYNKTLKKAQKQLGKEYQRCAKATKADLIDLWSEIQDSRRDGTILVSDLYKYNRYFDLTNNLNAELDKLGLQEEKITEKYLLEMYNDNLLIVGNEVQFMPIIDNEKALRAINSTWCADGKSWSTRIWNNKSLLKQNIEDGIVDCIARGTSKNELVQTLMDNFGKSYYQADRLARTELSYVQNKSSLDGYLDAGIEYYEVLSNQADDDSCLPLNGRRFRCVDASVGENFPPFHPNCKCAILAVIN